MTDSIVKYKEVLKSVNEKNPSVTLVAVSKTKSFDAIMACYNEGARIFGENRVQEIDQKLACHPSDMKVYLIGHLQTNKVKKAVSLTDRIESVDSLRLLKHIESECEKQGKKIEILLEINSSGESQKSGFDDEDELFKAAEYAYNSEFVVLKGLMTVGPLGFDSEKNKKAFLYTKGLFDKMQALYSVDVLSMGMSADWQDAIDSGSTEVRIGSAIFGERK